MSTSVLIVEKDVGLMASLRAALAGRGFEVEETTDGKGAPELIRRKGPGCVVLAVDLDAGQNGYIICKKLKSDDDLKGVPVIIVGDPKGFAQHQKLKTRADLYLGKPLDAAALVEAVGGLIGFPAAAPAGEDFDPASLLDQVDAPGLSDAPQEENTGDADLALVDSMFEDKSAEVAIDEVALDSVNTEDEFDSSDRTVVGFVPLDHGTTKPTFQSSPSALDSGEAREIRAKVTELTGSLEEARGRTEELEAKVRELESDLETKGTELEAARASGGKSDNKEVFSLRDAANKKDKEILKLKNELNSKEQEILELKEKENGLERQVSETADELTQRDAQLKTQTTKADQLGAEKKKLDQQLHTAREEGRAASAQLSTLQMDYDAGQQRLAELEAQAEGVRASLQTSESGREQAEASLAEVRGELEALKGQLDERTQELEGARATAEQAQSDLDSTRSQLTSQATSFADEISGLRQRLAETEAETRKAEGRASQAAKRLKGVLDQQERVRASLQNAVDTLAETPAEGGDVDLDELAEA